MGRYAWVIEHDQVDGTLSKTSHGDAALAREIEPGERGGDWFLLLDGDGEPVALGRFRHEDYDAARGFTPDKSEDWFAPKDWAESEFGATQILYLEQDEHGFNRMVQL